MTLPQAEAFGLIGVTIAFFVWGCISLLWATDATPSIEAVP